MLTYIRVRFIDQTRTSEYSMMSLLAITNLVNLLEQNSMVESYRIYNGGRQVINYHTEYGLSSTFAVNKFSAEREE